MASLAEQLCGWGGASCLPCTHIVCTVIEILSIPYLCIFENAFFVVTVKLTVVNRVATVSVVPSASTLLLKALNEPKRDRKKVKNIKHDGNITMDDVIEVARAMRSRSMARHLSGTVKEMLGTANSLGCTVDRKSPREVQRAISEGEIEIPEE